MARVTQKCNVTITAEKAIQVIHHTKLKKKKKLHVFIHSFNKYLLSTYHVLDIKNIIVNRRTAPA